MKVKDQAEKMMKNGRAQYDECLNNAKDSLPSNPSYLRDDKCNSI